MVGKWIIASASLICFGSIAWAVKGHFLSHHPMNPAMRAISIASLAAMGWFIVRLARQPVGQFWPVPAVVICAALALFWWAVSATRSRRMTLAFDDDTPTFLRRDGPYRYIRHPFYASYILFWTATSLATRGVAQWLVPVAWTAIYIAAAKKEERKFAMSSLAERYKCYRASTGMLLPIKCGCLRL